MLGGYGPGIMKKFVVEEAPLVGQAPTSDCFDKKVEALARDGAWAAMPPVAQDQGLERTHPSWKIYEEQQQAGRSRRCLHRILQVCALTIHASSPSSFALFPL